MKEWEIKLFKSELRIAEENPAGNEAQEDEPCSYTLLKADCWEESCMT